jgi:hypothetical protein
MTAENLPAGIPESKGKHFVLARGVWLAVFAFGIFGTAVFAEPAITNIEKVIGLGQRRDVWCRPELNQAGTYGLLPAHRSALNVRSLS